MFPHWLRNGSVAAAALAASSMQVFASRPAEDPLLRLVPANAQIVAGIEDPHHGGHGGDQSGRLLLVTHNDNVDLSDWIALSGVDDRQQVDKLIEVAASSSRGELSEHLLLLRGSFDGRRILKAAQDSGAISDHYDGVRVAELEPFARERQEVQDTRWLAFPDESTVIFGTPALVKSALDRYVSASRVDAELARRLDGLRADVNCWSLLAIPGQMIAAHLLPGVLDETGRLSAQRVTSATVSVHYGSKERVDFAFGMDTADSASTFAAAIRGLVHLLLATDALRPRLEDVSVDGNEVRGSVRVAGQEFDPWLAGLSARVRTDARGESPAQVAAAR